MKRSVATRAACLFMNKNDSGDKQPALESLLVVLQSKKLFPYESNKNQAKK